MRRSLVTAAMCGGMLAAAGPAFASSGTEGGSTESGHESAAFVQQLAEQGSQSGWGALGQGLLNAHPDSDYTNIGGFGTENVLNAAVSSAINSGYSNR